MENKDIFSLLKSCKVFDGVPYEQLDWITAYSEKEKGEKSGFLPFSIA